MDFNFWFPVRIISGDSCVANNAKLFSLGSHAMIVCGKHGAASSGALNDVTSVLDSLNISYTVFDKCTENPPVELCYRGGKLCRTCGADFIIGIGGGSALDAAKAVAAYAANPELEPLDIYVAEKRVHRPLPVIAIPTTAGTGSEANGTSVMTLPDGMQKKSFGSDSPLYSFLDPRYTASLPFSQAMSCALDAFAHAFESYLSPKSTPASHMMACYAGKAIWNIIGSPKDSFTEEDRQALQNAACAAGLAISVTGTGFPHPLGYSLTMLDGISHGNACAVFYRHYIKYNMQNEKGNSLVCEFCRIIGSDPITLSDVIPQLSGVVLSLSEKEIENHVGLVSSAKNYTNSPYVLSDDEKLLIYRELFSKEGRV